MSAGGANKLTSDTGVKVHLEDQNNYALHCSGTVAASTLDTASEYQKGCLYTKTDVVTGSKALYENVGTLAVPSWNLVGEAAAGDITLAEGSVLVGAATGLATALDASTDTQILIGNGTTITSAALSGNATMTNAGVVTVTGAAGAFAAVGAITGPSCVVSAPTGAGIGYATGAGGAVTQITSRTTGVTLNTLTGQITTDTTSLAAGAAASFTVTNSTTAIGDVIVVSIQSGATTNQTNVRVTTVAAGSFVITVENNHASTAETGAIIINYAVIKAVAA